MMAPTINVGDPPPRGFWGGGWDSYCSDPDGFVCPGYWYWTRGFRGGRDRRIMALLKGLLDCCAALQLICLSCKVVSHGRNLATWEGIPMFEQLAVFEERPAGRWNRRTVDSPSCLSSVRILSLGEHQISRDLDARRGKESFVALLGYTQMNRLPYVFPCSYELMSSNYTH